MTPTGAPRTLSDETTTKLDRQKKQIYRLGRVDDVIIGEIARVASGRLRVEAIGKPMSEGMRMEGTAVGELEGGGHAGRVEASPGHANENGVTGTGKVPGREAVEKRSEGTRAEDLLFALASSARFFRGADGRLHARVAVNGRHEIFRLKSTAFRDWLVDGYLSANPKLPSQRAVQNVLQALEARARFEVDVPPMYVRVAQGDQDDGFRYYLDLGDLGGRAVAINASGWSVVDRPAVHFQRPQGHLALPEPTHDGSLALLQPFVNLETAEFRLLAVWMAAALRPAGPYPVLVIYGEQGSGKSTLARVIRQLIDPQTAPVLAEPHSTRDLMVTALNGWLLAYDNVSTLSSWLSDSLCRLASGGGFATRALFSDDDRKVIYAQRPIILNGIDEFVRRSDLADRAVFLHPPAIKPGKRREECEFWDSFRELQPKILGALLDAVVSGLRELPSVKLAELPRMADFARFGAAVGRGLGWPDKSFLSAYQENRREATDSVLEDSILGSVILWLHGRQGGNVNWARSPTQLLEELTDRLERKVAAAPGWPKTPKALGTELRRIAPQLREHGIFVRFGKIHQSRMIYVNAGTGAEDRG
jgi:energy-coupling factor transporter ATP-binding protein EcfA2